MGATFKPLVPDSIAKLSDVIGKPVSFKTIGLKKHFKNNLDEESDFLLDVTFTRPVRDQVTQPTESSSEPEPEIRRRSTLKHGDAVRPSGLDLSRRRLTADRESDCVAPRRLLRQVRGH